jgi:hypothetical protein
VYPAVLLMYFVSAVVILLASLALIVQVSLPYNKTGRASVLYYYYYYYYKIGGFFQQIRNYWFLKKDRVLCMRRTAGYTWTDYRTNEQIAKELKITPILDKLLNTREAGYNM